MVNDDPPTVNDCGTAFPSGNTRRVTKPKLFDEAMHVRLPGGTKARIDALRGTTRQGDFVRQVLLEALDRLESGTGKARTQAKP